jgi:hypothetical protein
MSADFGKEFDLTSRRLTIPPDSATLSVGFSELTGRCLAVMGSAWEIIAGSDRLPDKPI